MFHLPEANERTHPCVDGWIWIPPWKMEMPNGPNDMDKALFSVIVMFGLILISTAMILSLGLIFACTIEKGQLPICLDIRNGIVH